MTERRDPYKPLSQEEWDSLVQRYSELQAAFDAERAKAIAALGAAAPDLHPLLVNTLNLIDSGVLTAESLVRAVRGIAELTDPVLPSFVELCEVSSRLYLGPRPGTASAPEAGD